MARSLKTDPQPTAASALVERPQTWQVFQTCDCGRLWLWEQTGAGRQRVSPVGLPHVCTTQGPETRTPPLAETSEGAVALLLTGDALATVPSSIAQRKQDTNAETTTPPESRHSPEARSHAAITQAKYSTNDERSPRLSGLTGERPR